ncbi:uncharacterized protein LOC143366017 [Andrena cerasifolii]|uniref:uncharacterized protein LOC143366017 n=1 Tax=Andrena cerasifolii TaxID=2819439 RepID=UPI004037DCF1
MTRFARATGSKASNERMPNDATPWHVMKQQLEQNSSKQQEHPGRNKSVKELLQDSGADNARHINTDWAEFEETSTKKTKDSVAKQTKKKLRASLKSEKVSLNVADITENEKYVGNIKAEKKLPSKRNIDEVNNSTAEVKVKKFKKDKNRSNDVSSSQNAQGDHSVDDVKVKGDGTDAESVKLKKKRKKDKHNNGGFVETLIKDSDGLQSEKAESNSLATKQGESAVSKRQKRNMKKRKNTSWTMADTDNSMNVQDNQTNRANGRKENSHDGTAFNKKFASKSNNIRSFPNKFGLQKFENDNNNKRKPPKIRDNEEHKRRKEDLGPVRIMINGVEIDIVKFDGFPIKKEDAVRLTDLRHKMIMKGIPKKEIDAALKLERRKAEKALARIRRCVCFHCRKAGHNLSDCPELGSEQAATGICFKCGSTEHTHFECKVARPTEFRYATCFICREQGHIAKQCPDNPRGVYPQGGSCKVCGDITHLKKDCPDLITEKEESTITLNTITDGNIESLEESRKTFAEKDDKKSKKVVKF